MPLPLVLVPVAIITAGYGAKKGYDGYKDGSKAEEIISKAANRYNEHKQEYDFKNQSLEENLEKLGNLQLKIGGEFGEFQELASELLEKINSTSKNRDFKISIPKHKLDQIEDLSLSATTYMAQVAGAGVAGAGAAYAVYGGVMAFAAASTGTPIATLSGVAAYNATLAAIGGGSIATGGLGMAGGSMILGSVVAAPILAVAGFAYAKHKEKALKKALEYLHNAEEAIEKINMAIEYIDNVYETIDKIICALENIYKQFSSYFNELKAINSLLERGEDINKIDDTLLEIIDNGYAIATILADIITTPLFVAETNCDGEAILQKGAVKIKTDDNGLNILNNKELSSVLEKSLESTKKYK